MKQRAEGPFRCPGETYDISRAIHLGRLSSFYHACRHCSQRDDVEGLPLLVRQQWAAVAHGEPKSLLTAEGLAGIGGDELDAGLVRRFASAFGLWLRGQPMDGAASTVLLAGDDRPLTAELVAAASDGLRFVGCDVVDLGGGTAASLAARLAATDANAGVLIGNGPSALRTASVHLWGPRGLPISEATRETATDEEVHLLDRLWSQAREPIVRPERRSGAWRRGSCEPEYLATLLPHFHALRPLRFLLDTNCIPLKRYLRRLLANVACRAFSASECHETAAPPMHFQVWTDGNGESVRLKDEQGLAVGAEELFALLALHLAKDRQQQATVIVEHGTSDATCRRLMSAGLRVVDSGSTRRQVHSAMLAHDALMAGGPSGRVWFRDPAPAADALRVVAQLLVILSQSDRPLSQVLQAA